MTNPYTKLVTLTLKKPYYYEAFWENGIYMGDVIMDVDGYYKWWTIPHNGYLDDVPLLAMAYKLQELNREWDEQIANDPSLRHGEHDMERRESI